MKAPKLAAILFAVALAPTWVAAADKTDQSATSSTQADQSTVNVEEFDKQMSVDSGDSGGLFLHGSLYRAQATPRAFAVSRQDDHAGRKQTSDALKRPSAQAPN